MNERGLIMNYDKNDCNHPICKDDKKEIIGESVDVNVKKPCESEIKADITVKEWKSVRIWGQIKNCYGNPISQVLVKLLRCDCGDFKGVAHTISDCDGFYQFDLCPKTANGNYKIIASKVYSCAKKSENCAYQSYENNSEKKCCHCKNRSLCESCAYYDETLKECCFPNHVPTCHCQRFAM